MKTLATITFNKHARLVDYTDEPIEKYALPQNGADVYCFWWINGEFSCYERHAIDGIRIREVNEEDGAV